ncbi:MAG: type II secretion system protein [Verrucomicrobia bacterium]|nr:type II secretion system protein [Verrucomicrobiota bacterium]
MPVFAYSARTKAGEKVGGTVEAADRRAALRIVERMGNIPVSVEEKSAAAAKTPEQVKHFAMPFFMRERMGTRELLVFTTELSDLLSAGMTLGNALNSLAHRKTGKVGDKIVQALRDDIINGVGLSEAMAKHPATFSKLYVSMIRAGEASGAMQDVLKRLLEHYERMQDLKEKVTMALIYPVIVVVMGIFTMIFAMLFVIPKFKMIFDQLGQSLPLSTRIMVGMSGFVGKYGWLVLLVAVMGSIFANRAVKTESGRLWWHGVQLKTPLIRGIVACSIYASFSRTLATLLSNGVPVLQALGIVEQIVGNAVIAKELRNARDRVTDGTTISGPLAAGKVFPRIMTDMLAIGEQTGDMPGSLTHIARRYENELTRNIKIFTTALEPMLIVLVAAGVGFVALSVLMAVLNMTTGLSK